MTTQPFLDTLGNHVERRLRTKVLHGLHPSQTLKAVLQRERIRTDRTGHGFCWVLFSLDPKLHTKRTLQRLAYLIARRARLMDEVGWYDEAGVGAILPVTDETGAAHFAREIIRLAVERGIYPKVTVYSYLGASSSSDVVRPKESLTSSSKTGHALRMHNIVSFGAAQGGLRQFELRAMELSLARPIAWGKRVSDIVGAGLGLLVTSPIFLAAAIAVRLSSPGPAFFAQKRAGLGGRPFIMYKFRSMHIDAEARKDALRHLNEHDGPAFKISNDPRITSIGRFLRATSIDELPQLFNVLKGDMSLVGPRPATFDEVDKYHVWYRRRLQVTPGITCIWQVRGRSRVSFEEWMRMDLQYIKQYGFWQDFKLILGTIPSVLLRRGAH